jgi:hypothetical protein
MESYAINAINAVSSPFSPLFAFIAYPQKGFMGKYLDLAKRVEARLKSQAAPLSQVRHGVRSPDMLSNLSLVATEVFSDREGILVTSAVLGFSVWVVRSRQDGENLANETGHPALLLDDALRQEGKTTNDVRHTLLPILICPQ